MGQWWWVVDPWVAVVCWCDGRGVIFAMVWWLICLFCIREERDEEREREREKDRDDVAVYDEYFIVMFILFYYVKS